MRRWTYFNEIDQNCAFWLRDLIKRGELPDGEVDTRSIADVRPADLAGFTDAHWFAGLGGWPYAMRLAGYPDDGPPVWTGSCPCQPFSQAGKGEGFADERHLWPDWFWHIEQCRPGLIFGEQVSGPDGLMWLDLVFSDLEGSGYAAGALDCPVAGVGAPNQRQRLWWAAERLADAGLQRRSEAGADHTASRHDLLGGGFPDGRLADPQGGGRGEHRLFGEAPGGWEDTGQPAQRDEAPGALADAGGDRRDDQPGERREQGIPGQRGRQPDHGSWLGHPERPRLPDAGAQDLQGARRGREGGEPQPSGAPRDPWRQLEWIACLDGRSRPTKPGLFPLAARLPGDVARLRAAGNAISPVVAAEFIKAYLATRT